MSLQVHINLITKSSILKSEGFIKTGSVEHTHKCPTLFVVISNDPKMSETILHQSLQVHKFASKVYF